MYNSIFYDFLKINRKRTNLRLGWSVICLLLITSHWSFATTMFEHNHTYGNSAITEKSFSPEIALSPMGVPCSQITNGDDPVSNGFIFEDDSSFVVDIPIYQGTTFELKQIKLSIFDVATYFNIIIYEDDSGKPGNVFQTFSNVSIASTVFKTTAFNIDLYEYTLDISAENLVFTSPSGDSVYWMEVKTDGQGWETTDNLQVGSMGLISSSDTFFTWQPLEIFTFDGEIRDFVYELIGECTGCYPPLNLTFTQNSLTSGDLGWISNGTLFDVEWGTAGFTQGSGTQINGITINSLSVNTTTDTLYEFYVRNDCGADGTSGWTGPFQFKTSYCEANYVYDCVAGTSIGNFETSGALVNIQNFSGATCSGVGYVDYTNFQFVTEAGATISFTTSIGAHTGAIKVWCDWNADGIFDDDELLGESQMLFSADETYTNSFTVPTTQSIGDYRVRVRYVYNTIDFTACSQQGQGEIEDYTIKVVAPQTCNPPTDLLATAVSLDSVALSWNDNGGTNFIVEWGLAPFDAGNGTSINVAGNTTQVTSILLDTPYWFYVRQDCGTDGLSLWAGPFSFKTGYCTDNLYNFGCSLYSKIVNIETSGGIIDISNNTGTNCGTTGYHDFTNLFAEVLNGDDISVSVEIGSYHGAVKVWIDWNKNGVFESSELITESSIIAPGDVHTASFTIDQNIPLGDYRMRVRVAEIFVFDACGTLVGGETEDYTIRITTPPACFPPTGLSVGVITENSAELIWNTNSTSTNFIVEWGIEGFTPGTGNVVNVATNSYTITGLTQETSYQFYVTTDCGTDGLSTQIGPRRFFTGYCSATTISVGDNIESFITTGGITNISNTNSGASPNGYGDFSAMIVSTFDGAPNINFEVTTNSSFMTLGVWIDWNRNMIFENNEVIYISLDWGNSFEGSIPLPQGQAPGDYRMRVRGNWFNAPFPCGSTTYGETEDYTFRVIPIPSCIPIFNPTATNYSTTSTLLEWTSDGNLFDIEYGPSGFTQGSGTMLSGATTTNSYLLTGLTPEDSYDYYVRRDCGSGDFSDWVGPITFVPGSFMGEIPTMLNTNPQVASLSCGATFAVDVPTGKQIANIKVEYTMVSSGEAWISHQRSALYSPTLGFGESDVAIPPANNDFPGVWDYQRDVSFANGATGTVEFELKGWRIGGGFPVCNANYVFIVNGTWILTPTFEDIPACPNPPFNLGYNVISETEVQLNWSASFSGATHQLKWGNFGFDIASEGTTEDNLTTNSLVLSGLDSSIPYEFYVRRDCGAGDFSTWTGPFKFNSGYCIPTSNFTYYFTSFTTSGAIQNISYSNDSAGSGYADNTDDDDLIIEQTHGNTINFTSNYIGGASGLRIWVDWNNDFVFDDSEQIFYVSSSSGNKSGVFTVPLNTISGDYRMRVRSEQGNGSIPSACGKIDFGEALDFILRVDGVVSVANFDLYEFSYYPNPVNDVLYFSSNQPIEKVLISNILGQQISANLNSDNTTLDMSNLPSGNYFVKITIEGVSKTIKVIKN